MAFNWALSRWGERWQIRGISDPAIFPLVVFLIGILAFVLTPVLNTETRTQEKEADMFGLNAARQPDGFAQAAIHLGEYRKMHPGPIEELIFFDHPSGYNRIHSAMVWKSQNLELFGKAAAASRCRNDVQSKMRLLTYREPPAGLSRLYGADLGNVEAIHGTFTNSSTTINPMQMHSGTISLGSL